MSRRGTKEMSKITSEHTTIFNCCEKDFLPGEPIRTHLKEAHGLTELKGTRKLVMALDGDEYCNIFELQIGGVTLRKISKGPSPKV